MNQNKNNNSINRVKCMVNTCIYHGEGDHCNAPSIEIQPKNATSAQETDCATFVPSMKG